MPGNGGVTSAAARSSENTFRRRAHPLRARLLNEPPRGTSFFCFISFICVCARTPVPPCTTRDNDARDNSTDLALGGSDCCGDGDRRDGGSDDTFPLLDQLLEELPEVLERFVLPELDANDLPMLARAGGGWRSTVVSSNLPCAGSTAGSRLTLDAFIWHAGPSIDLPGAKADGTLLVE